MDVWKLHNFWIYQGKGIDYLITKPFSGDEMEAAVTGLFKERHIKNVLQKTNKPYAK